MKFFVKFVSHCNEKDKIQGGKNGGHVYCNECWEGYLKKKI